MGKYKIYRGRKPNGKWKIGTTIHYPYRCKKQKLNDYHILEEHDCKYTASNREIELQKQYGYDVDTTKYWKIYDEKIKGHSEETKLKIRKAREGQDVSVQIAALKKHNTGRKYSKKHRQAISKATIGRTWSESTRKLWSEQRTGVKRSEEFCKKVSEATKGHIKSDEHRKNLSLSNYGKGVIKEHHVIWMRNEYKRKSDYFGERITQDRLANIFGVKQSLISQILNKKKWGHI